MSYKKLLAPISRRIPNRVKRILKRILKREQIPFIFIHINKTGGTSIEKALDLRFEHVTALEKIDKLGRHEWNRNFTFAVVRNPWDKVVSHYHYRIKKNISQLQEKPIDFTTWCKLTYGAMDPYYYDKPMMFMPQTDWISDEKGGLLVDEIIRFENLDAEFQHKILKRIRRKASLPHKNKSNHKPYKEYYDNETIEIVAQWFKKDIELFGYKY